MPDPGALALHAACARVLAKGHPLLAGSGPQSRGQVDRLACASAVARDPCVAALRPAGEPGPLFDALILAGVQWQRARHLPGMVRNLLGEVPATPQERWTRWALQVHLGRNPAGCPAAFAQALGGLTAAAGDSRLHARRAAAMASAWVDQLRGETDFGPAAGACTAEPSATSMPPSPGEADPPADAAPAPADAATPDAAGQPLPEMPADLGRGYKIYTRRYDRQVRPDDLAAPDRLADLRARLDAEVRPWLPGVARLTHQLLRSLQARHRPWFEADQATGVIDPTRLAPLVADPSRVQIFRAERDQLPSYAAVTLLLDNSGSMRGRPILLAALVADMLAKTLERCAVPLEILGYTTQDRAGGDAQRAWALAGSPSEPGRLSALRHIVYKAADRPWRHARRGLGVMLAPDLLQDNVDGEALAWAAQRLLQRPEPRRLLIIVSDGAPRDSGTEAVNSEPLLDRHLHQVVAWIRDRTDLDLRAVGIGHRVDRHYPRAVRIDRPEQLAAELVRLLNDALA